jgi:dihydrolipoamide dehydrogenase
VRAGQYGLKTCLIERQPRLGGTCLLVGCIPTKALLHTADVWDYFKNPAAQGISCKDPQLNYSQVLDRKNKIVSKHSKGIEFLMRKNKVDVIRGDAKLQGRGRIAVNGAQGAQSVEAKNIILATGSEARMLPGLQPDPNLIFTNVEILDMPQIPRSIGIIGAGAVGVEFASIFNRFGSEVTIVEMLPHLLPAEDESSSRLLERAFRRRGIGFHVGTRFEGVKETGNGVSVTLEGGNTIDAELLLVAVGRGPVSAGLGYEEAGVTVDRGFVIVDEYCRTSVPAISAVGDLTPGLQLAHVGFAEGILVAERVSGLPVTPIDYDGVPRIAYSDPEVASVGITSAAAQARGIEITEVNYNLGGNGKSVILQTQGAAKVIAAKGADGTAGPVLGVHLVGARVGELIAEGQLIYNWEALPSEVAQLIHPHPTQSEAIGEAHLALAGKPLHFHS